MRLRNLPFESFRNFRIIGCFKKKPVGNDRYFCLSINSSLVTCIRFTVKMYDLGMGTVEVNDKKFPGSLRGIKPKVERLYCKGNLRDELFQKCVAVVGSRRMTQYGQRIIERIIPSLVSAGITVVSGFMYGVDQEAHKRCLLCGGKTVAVLGWGIDWQVEDADKKLYKEIEDKGLIMSEYKEDTKPQLWMFPRRNRIIAGLSQAVLIV